MLLELVVMAVVLASGTVISHTLGFRGWGNAPWGYALGTFAYVVIGALQVVLGLSTSPIVTLLTLPVLAGVVWWLLWRRGGLAPFPWAIAGVALVAGAAIVVVARVAHFTEWTYDSLRYLTVGGLLAGGSYDSAVSEVMLEKRLLAVGIIHAPANLDGGAALASATPLLAMSLLGLVIWFIQRGTSVALGNRAALYWGVLGAAVILTINRMVFAALYINGHILVAAAVLVVATGGWIIVTGPQRLHRPLLLGMALGTASAVVARPDAVALFAVLLIPILLTPTVHPSLRAAPLASLGLATVAWYAFSIYRHHEIGVEPSSATKGFLVLGVLSLAAVPLLYWQFLTRNRKLFRGIVEGVVWLSSVAVCVRAPQVVWMSVEATWQNVVMGAGGWSLSLVFLGGALVAAIAAFRLPGAESMRYAVTTFFPLVIVFVVARGPAYRVGGGDSLNRSWTHIVAPAVVLLIATVAAGASRFEKKRQQQSSDPELTSAGPPRT
jgi:hypothetical protein